MNNKTFDFVVVGAGIVGLTTARALLKKWPGSSIAILEKEPGLGFHASGRNSGVVHCGIYYGSQTLKAKVCTDGARRMIEFARSENIALNQSGKIILATAEHQLPVIEKLMINAKESNIPAELLGPQQIADIEPFAARGPAAIFCPTTAVIDSAGVLTRIREQLQQHNVVIQFGCAVQNIHENDHGQMPHKKGRIQTSAGAIDYGYLINCAGAHADQIAQHFGIAQDYRLVPFKGIYWKLAPAINHKVRANIYPVPDISMPFLGVHLTRVISGDVYVGPTAIPAFGRENYGLIRGLKITESLEIIANLAGIYWKNNNNFRKLTHRELSKYCKHNFLKAARTLMPELRAEDLVRSAKVGIRPQLMNVKSRTLEMDYILAPADKSLHVLNAISPAFTSSLAFADLIVDHVAQFA